MPDYQKGKIYTIRCRNDDTLIYVGSTIQSLAKRWGGHKRDSLKYSNMLLYKSINHKWEDWYIELYELYPCNSKMELEKREGEVIRKISTLNKFIAGRTKKEYYLDNLDKIREYRLKNSVNIRGKSKQYYLDNKDEIIEKNKKYRLENADDIKTKSKKYYLENADDIIKKSKKYYLDNIDKIKEYKKEHYLKKKAEKQEQQQKS